MKKMAILFIGILAIIVILVTSVADIYHGEGAPEEDPQVHSFVPNLL